MRHADTRRAPAGGRPDKKPERPARAAVRHSRHGFRAGTGPEAVAGPDLPRSCLPRAGSFAAYLAADGFTRELLDELDAARPGCVLAARGRLVLASGAPLPAAWAQNVWLEPWFQPAPSVSEAARRLKAVQRNWHAHPVDFHRRASLIAGQLPPVRARPLRFGERPPASPLGSWTLWDRDLLLASARCSSPFPDGEVRFEEDRQGPPSRAYLKLWECFTLLDQTPAPGELCVDLGAAPGGWTWALARMGCRVLSLDRAPLDPRVAALPGVDFCRGSGFGLEPALMGRTDWLFSDMACYPRRLLAAARRWLEAGAAAHFVCTLKFQGSTDHECARAFAALPGSTLLHLSCNRHELTWVCHAPQARPARLA